jgi:hypothetical protein
MIDPYINPLLLYIQLNSLYKSGDVVAVFPDWWEEVRPR